MENDLCDVCGKPIAKVLGESNRYRHELEIGNYMQQFEEWPQCFNNPRPLRLSAVQSATKEEIEAQGKSLAKSYEPGPRQARILPMNGAEMIAAERQRQIASENWTPALDDKHDSGSLVAAAVTYALEATYDGPDVKGSWFKKFWCFEDHWFKPKDKVRDLVKAGSLIAAEIDRLQRLQGVVEGGFSNADDDAHMDAGSTNPTGEPR